MTIEVTSGEFGRAHARVVRDVAPNATAVRVTVFDTSGVATTDVLALALKPAGRGFHRRFRCPRCLGCVALVVPRCGRLVCAACAKALTRRQAERTTRAWRHLGGEEEDRILRHISAGRLTAARKLIEALREADATRIAQLRADVGVALALMGATTATVPPPDAKTPLAWCSVPPFVAADEPHGRGDVVAQTRS